MFTKRKDLKSVKNYKGFDICVYPSTYGGFYADGWNEDGNVIIGFGNSKEDAISNFCEKVDEHIETFGYF
jgi:hypothetical protein